MTISTYRKQLRRDRNFANRAMKQATTNRDYLRALKVFNLCQRELNKLAGVRSF